MWAVTLVSSLADLELSINVLEKIDKDAGWHLWVSKFSQVGNPQGPELSSGCSPGCKSPVHDPRQASQLLLHLLSPQKSPCGQDAAQGVAGSLGWPHTVAHMFQQLSFPGASPIQDAILRQSSPC